MSPDSPSAPRVAAARLIGRRGRVLLHSGRDDDGCGAWSFAACEPVAAIAAWGRRVAILGADGAVREHSRGDPFDILERLVAEHCADWIDVLDGPVPVAMGYLGYDLGAVIERSSEDPAPGAERDADAMPDMWFGLYDAVWRFDHRSQAGDILGGDVLGRTPAARRALADALRTDRDHPAAAPVLGPLRPRSDDVAYQRGVERILEYIHAGDVYQVNLARQLVAPLHRPGDPLAVYTALDRVAPAPYGAVMSLSGTSMSGIPDAHLLSGSPERFLHRAPGSALIETRPIKGTRRRTGDAGRDRLVVDELQADDKERAEHLMIVDLERNDLGRFADIGSVQVDRLGYVVELPHLYHVVSRVSARVPAGIGWAEILRATFPGGSITGAPKIRAMEIIAELEEFRRGPYTGAIGYLGLRQAMDFSVAIRTALLSPDELVLCVGGGIVADSTAARELEETEEKAAGWRRALTPDDHPGER